MSIANFASDDRSEARARTGACGSRDMTSVADDISLALQLADQADALTMERFGALDLRIETKPDLTPVTDADRGAEEIVAGGAVGEQAGRRAVGRRVRRHSGFRRTPVGARPDRRHQELRSRAAGVGDADCLTRRWRPRGRRRQCARVGTSVVGRIGRGRVRLLRRRDAAHLGVRRRRRGRLPVCRSPTSPRLGRRASKFLDLVDAVWRVRGYGDFWSYCLLPKGPWTSSPNPR